MNDLEFAIDSPLSDTVRSSQRALLLVRGWIAPRPSVHLRRYRIEMGGQIWTQEAASERLANAPQPYGRASLGIFIPVALPKLAPGQIVTLRIVAEHSAGSTTLVDQFLRCEEPVPRKTLDIDAPIAICLATYNPNEQLLARQLDSLRAQTRRDWVCIVHDDGSTPDHAQMIRHYLAADERFHFVRSERNRGFYRNFEAALALVPPSTPWVALCDQDDRWYPDKLAATIDALESQPAAQLAYCDMRIVDQNGQRLSPSYWHMRRNNYQHLDALLLANTVTGAACLFRGRLLELLLPFPPAHGNVFHDHWISCCALVSGGIAYVDRPLYDYTQHGSNVIGQTDFAPIGVPGALKRHVTNVAEMILKPWHIAPSVRAMLDFYYSDYRRLQLFANTLKIRLPSLSAAHHETLSYFEDRLPCALHLMFREHAQIVLRGDSTDFVEFKMGLGMLFDRILGLTSQVTE